MLYSQRDLVWKVADFGFTTKLQSQSSLLSREDRGTDGYYPPEFLEEVGDLRYNTSLDIWQMGCILFEFAVGKRAFRTNFDTRKFREGRMTLDIDLDEYFGEDCKEEIRRCLTLMLHIEPSQRPSAGQLVTEIQHYLQRPNQIPSNSQTNIRVSFLPPTSTQVGIASNHSHNTLSPVFDIESISAASRIEPGLTLAPLSIAQSIPQPSPTAHPNPDYVPPTQTSSVRRVSPPTDNARWSDLPPSSLASENANPQHVPPVKEPPVPRSSFAPSRIPFPSPLGSENASPQNEPQRSTLSRLRPQNPQSSTPPTLSRMSLGSLINSSFPARKAAISSRKIHSTDIPASVGAIVPAGPEIVGEYQFQRPYTYKSTIKSGRRIYVELGKDLAVVHEFLQGTGSMQDVVSRLALRSVSQIEALNHHIRARGNLYAGLDFEAKVALVGDGRWTAALQYATMGLLLGPLGFDVWLLNQVITRSSSEMG